MKPTFSQKLKYRFDNFMSKGTIALIVGLFSISLIIIVVGTVVLTAFSIQPADGDAMGFFEAFWQTLMRTLDSGAVGADQGWTYRAIMFTVTLGGIFILSALIGVLNSGLESKLDSLRKGKSMVIESNHTIIIGWSKKVFTIVSELAEANANLKNSSIVILGDKDKVEMEEEIRENVPDLKTTRVVCRSGKSISMKDLAILNPFEAKSIIVISPEKDDPDADVIKTVLALTNNPNRPDKKLHIVAEINNVKNASVCLMVGKDEIEVVLSSEIISKITAQTCRQSGLSLVYMDLMVYEGDEIYFQNQSELVGKTYGDALSMYDNSSLIGIQKLNGNTIINPKSETIIEKEDQLICISQDDDTIKLNGKKSQIDSSVFTNQPNQKTQIEKTLILGWNKRGVTIVHELDAYVSEGSEITIMAQIDQIETILQDEFKSLKNHSIQILNQDTTDRDVLESINLMQFNHIILLSYSSEMPAEEADSITLITLLHLRDISEKLGVDMSIVSELLMDENRALAEVTNADDFIVSEKVISLLLTQISEKKELSQVFADIFNPEGSEIYIKPMSDYIDAGQEIDFYTVVEAARRRNETAIGYRLMQFERDASQKYGVKINPRKSDKIKFSQDDKIIVLSEG